MREQARAVHGIHTAVSVDIGALQCVGVGQRLGLVHMREQARAVHGIHTAVPVHISQQPNLCVLRLRIAAYRHGVFPGDMILLRHLHGIGTGGNLGDVVNCGIFPAALFPGGHRYGVLGLCAAVSKQGDGHIAVIVEAHHLTAYTRSNRDGVSYGKSCSVPVPRAYIRFFPVHISIQLLVVSYVIALFAL